MLLSLLAKKQRLHCVLDQPFQDLTDLYQHQASEELLAPLWSQAGVGAAAETVGQLRLSIFEWIGIRKEMK